MRARHVCVTSTGERRFSRNSKERSARVVGSSSVSVSTPAILQPPGSRYDLPVRERLLKAARGFDRRVWLLLVAMLAWRFGQGLFFPFSTIYFHNVLGIPLSLVGVGFGTLAAASVVSGLVSGPLTDRYGRKPLMLAALLGSTASFFAFSLIEGFAGYLVVSVVPRASPATASSRPPATRWSPTSRLWGCAPERSAWYGSAGTSAGPSVR